MNVDNKRPVEYTNVDKRGDLTGPDGGDKRDYPKLPQHVPIDPKQKK